MSDGGGPDLLMMEGIFVPAAAVTRAFATMLKTAADGAAGNVTAGRAAKEKVTGNNSAGAKTAEGEAAQGKATKEKINNTKAKEE